MECVTWWRAAHQKDEKERVTGENEGYSKTGGNADAQGARRDSAERRDWRKRGKKEDEEVEM